MYTNILLPSMANMMHGLLFIISCESYLYKLRISSSKLHFFALLLYGSKEKGDRFKNKSRYTKPITQLSDAMISIEHGVNVKHYIAHHIMANESSNTKSNNGIKKLQALVVFEFNWEVASGWNRIPMLFGSICDIWQWYNGILTSSESKCSLKGSMIYSDEKWEQ